MKRQIITSLALVACMAAGAQTKMTLDLTGKNATFSLDNVSKITFSEEGMLNVFDKLGASQSFSLDEVRKISFAGDFTAINDTKTDPAAGVSFQFDGNAVRVNGIANTSTARLASVSGALVGMQKVDNGGTIDVSSLAKGVYVLTVDGKTFKFVK